MKNFSSLFTPSSQKLLDCICTQDRETWSTRSVTKQTLHAEVLLAAVDCRCSFAHEIAFVSLAHSLIQEILWTKHCMNVFRGYAMTFSFYIIEEKWGGIWFLFSLYFFSLLLLVLLLLFAVCLCLFRICSFVGDKRELRILQECICYLVTRETMAQAAELCRKGIQHGFDCCCRMFDASCTWYEFNDTHMQAKCMELIKSSCRLLAYRWI